MPRDGPNLPRLTGDTKDPRHGLGMVIDGRLAHVGTAGVRDRAANAPVIGRDAFRIASMTKSFTVLAILKLRDEGKLSLEDPVSKWIPEFSRMELPTRDSAPLQIRQLMSHSTGWPEDNPWGDQQLGATDDQVTEWLPSAFHFPRRPIRATSTPTTLSDCWGACVARASGVPYEKYVQDRDSGEARHAGSDVPILRSAARETRDRISYSARRNLSGRAAAAQRRVQFRGRAAHHGRGLGKYIAFHLSAWPPRDEPETGPVRRSSVREMSHMWTPSNLTARISRRKGPSHGIRLRVRFADQHRLPVRTHRWTWRRAARLRFLHDVASRLRGWAFRDG